MLHLLLRPFSYLTIQHPDRTPIVINWVVPLGLAAIIFLVPVLVFGKAMNVWGDTGIIVKAMGFVQSLPGFYVAALAAVATFGSSTMKRLMPGTPPTMRIWANGAWAKTPLTRRLFLSSMFAYLTAVSFIATGFGFFGLSIADPLKSILPVACHLPFKIFAGFIYVFMCSQLVVITFWGLYYLGERMHLLDT